MIDIKNLKITTEDLTELQEDLEDAATDLGEEMAWGSLDEELNINKDLEIAMERFCTSSEKLKNAIKIFVRQNEV